MPMGVLSSVCMLYVLKVYSKWINERRTSSALGPVCEINVLLSRMTVSQRVMRRDEFHSSPLIY